MHKLADTDFLCTVHLELVSHVIAVVTIELVHQCLTLVRVSNDEEIVMQVRPELHVPGNVAVVVRLLLGENKVNLAAASHQFHENFLVNFNILVQNGIVCNSKGFAHYGIFLS